VDDEEDEDRQAMELRFEMQYREVEKYDKEKELKGMVATGEDRLTDKAMDNVEKGRERRHLRLLEGQALLDSERVESVLTQDRVAVPTNYKPVAQPHWDEYANDTFSMRLQVIDRFVRAGSKCLMRVRCQQRLERLREAMRAASVNSKASCTAWVDAENKAAAAGGRGAQRGSGGDAAAATGGGDDENDVEAFVRITCDFVLPMQVPTAQSSMNAEERHPIEVTPLDNFDEWKTIDIQPRLDFKVLQYEKYEVPAAAAYMRLNDTRQKSQAALEELSIRGPRGDIFDGAEEPVAMPESCLLPPQHDPLSLLVPSTECRTYIAFPEFTECDFEYRLSQPPELLEPSKMEPLLPPDIMCLDKPWLGTWRRTRELQDPFSVFDPLPGSLCHGGGRFGPRLLADAGGERLEFLPVGGFNRDIPSDTDSDERDAFELPVPSQDEYKKALRHMDCKLESELWYKERRAEEQLRTQCAASNRAVRDRLRSFNEHLDHTNKLYLG